MYGTTYVRKKKAKWNKKQEKNVARPSEKNETFSTMNRLMKKTKPDRLVRDKSGLDVDGENTTTNTRANVQKTKKKPRPENKYLHDLMFARGCCYYYYYYSRETGCNDTRRGRRCRIYSGATLLSRHDDITRSIVELVYYCCPCSSRGVRIN